MLAGALLLCGCLGATSWLWVTRYLRFPHDPLDVFGLAFAIFITASITYRSPLFADRVVFGGATAVLVLEAVRAAPLPSAWMLALRTAEALVWTIAAGVCAVALVRRSAAPRGSD
jgi:hypothetical protein